MGEARTSFFVGGRYVEDEHGKHLIEHAYVQRRGPEKVTQPYPVVMIPGGHQSAMNFEATPDGRPSWADWFVDHGYQIYLLDQPGLGRSAYVPAAYGELVPPRDPRALAEVLHRYALDPDRRRRHGAAGRLRVSATFALESMATRYAELYDSLFGVTGPRPGHI